jgi:hypothetical protein
MKAFLTTMNPLTCATMISLGLSSSLVHAFGAPPPPSALMRQEIRFASSSRANVRQCPNIRLNSLPTDLTIASQTESNSDQPLSQSVATVTTKSYLDDGFVFGLPGSGLQRPKGKVPSLVVEGDSLETTPSQVIMVVGTFLAHAWFASHAVSGMLAFHQGAHVLWTAAHAILLIVASWVAADFGSGVLHWSVDNYGNGRTPIMGSIIAAFQGHHSAPWTITKRGFANNVHKLCIPFGVVPMSLITAIASPSTALFFTFFCVFEILSQEFHKWSHMTKGECPTWVNWMQSVGLSVARKPHALHHMEPFDGNYCIISGICNKPLDTIGLFRRLEHLIYQLNGVESNAWKLDPEVRERTLRGEYGIPSV